MKKQLTLTALAAMVLSSLSVAQAQQQSTSDDTTTLYGRIGYGVSTNNKKDENGRKRKTVVDLKNNGVRLGIKGTEGLASGLQAIYKLEFGYDTDTFNGAQKEIRQAWVGLASDFGTLTFGKQDNLRDDFFGRADEFVEVSGSMYTNTRNAKLVKYVTSQQFADDYGVTIGLAGVLDGSNTYPDSGRSTPTSDSRNFSTGQAAIQYTWNGISIASTYTSTDGDADLNGNPTNKNGTQEAVTASLSYGNPDDQGLYAGFDYEHASSRRNYYALLAQYRLDDTNTFRIGAEANDPTQRGLKTAYRGMLGYQYNFSKRTFAWVEAAYQKNSVSGAEEKGYYEAVVGLRHNF